jgi:type II secretory pathway pseudopilin PulG
MIAAIIMSSLAAITLIVWLASKGKVDAVRAAIYTGAIGSIGTIATALVSELK